MSKIPYHNLFNSLLHRVKDIESYYTSYMAYSISNESLTNFSVIQETEKKIQQYSLAHENILRSLADLYSDDDKKELYSLWTDLWDTNRDYEERKRKIRYEQYKFLREHPNNVIPNVSTTKSVKMLKNFVGNFPTATSNQGFIVVRVEEDSDDHYRHANGIVLSSRNQELLENSESKREIIDECIIEGKGIAYSIIKFSGEFCHPHYVENEDVVSYKTVSASEHALLKANTYSTYYPGVSVVYVPNYSREGVETLSAKSVGKSIIEMIEKSIETHP